MKFKILILGGNSKIFINLNTPPRVNKVCYQGKLFSFYLVLFLVKNNILLSNTIMYQILYHIKYIKYVIYKKYIK